MTLSEEATRDLIEETGPHRALKLPETREIGEVLRAAQLGRQWLETVEALTPQGLPPLKCFILGYLAAVKDRG